MSKIRAKRCTIIATTKTPKFLEAYETAPAYAHSLVGVLLASPVNCSTPAADIDEAELSRTWIKRQTGQIYSVCAEEIVLDKGIEVAIEDRLDVPDL